MIEHRWGQRVVRFYDPDRHIIEVGENMKTVCRHFLDSGMTPEETAVRMDVPLKAVKAYMQMCIRDRNCLKKADFMPRCTTASLRTQSHKRKRPPERCRCGGKTFLK